MKGILARPFVAATAAALLAQCVLLILWRIYGHAVLDMTRGPAATDYSVRVGFAAGTGVLLFAMLFVAAAYPAAGRILLRQGALAYGKHFLLCASWLLVLAIVFGLAIGALAQSGPTVLAVAGLAFGFSAVLTLPLSPAWVRLARRLGRSRPAPERHSKAAAGPKNS